MTSLLIMLCILHSAKAQQSIPGNYFQAPLDIPLYLSGNFGELRSNHFHSGIDIKTQGVIGHRVNASAEGYISRIKIEAAGYGNTLYITHPAGYTTVYGHLDRFRQDISKYVKKLQYEKQQHTINIYPAKEEWPVAKGEFIAFSGTSGYSFGPHLHFEIRDASSQDPMNVMQFGFDIKDDIPPRIFSVYVYPMANNGLVNNSNEKIRFETVGDIGKFHLPGKDTIRLDGSIGFGIEAYDYLNGASNRCGLFSLQVLVDDVLKFHWKMDRFSFSESSYISSYIDYEEKVKNGITLQKTFLDPNNKLGLYSYVENSGILDFSEDRIYHVSFQLEDVYGNRSDLDMLAKGGSRNGLNRIKEEETGNIIFSCMYPNTFSREGIELKIPQGALYRDLRFTYSRTEMLPGTYSPVHHLHDPYTPIHLDCELSIEATGLADSLRDKSLLCLINDQEKFVSAGGEWMDGRVVGKIHGFGRYTVTIDTVPPEIKPLEVEADMSDRNSIRFLAKDELSGMKSYEGYIDNEWALFEYDLKNDLVYYVFDDSRITRDSQHELELYIIDNKDNISYYYTEFYW